jgi:RNA polymerase sigma-70 factor (ECF subfamily)
LFRGKPELYLIHPLENEAEVVKRCQSGEVQAFEEIYRHFKDAMFGTAFRMLGSKEDAKDALQTTFIKLYQGIGNFKQDSRLSTYLFRILLHVCYDVLQDAKVHERQPVTENDLYYQPGNELQIQMEEAVRNLPERMRECFVLYAIEGFQQDEIARILGVKTGTVKAHLFQAREKLRGWLGPL